MSNKTKLIPAAILLLSGSANAMNLTEALSSTYEANETLQSSRQHFLSEIEAFPQALASFLPDVNASIGVQNQKQKRYLQPGNSAEAGPEGSRSIQLSQNIFSGGSSVFGLKAAQDRFWISRSELYNKEQDVLIKAVEAYLNVAAAKAKYEIALDSLAFYKRNLRQAEEKLKVGESTITEVSLAKSNVSNGMASKSKHYAELLAAKANFKTITNLDATDDMTFLEKPSDLPENLAELEAKTMKTNLHLISARNALKFQKDTANQAKGALLPRADLTLGANKNFSGDHSKPVDKRLSVSTSVSVNIPIFTKGGATYSSIRTQNKKARQAVHSLDQTEREIKAATLSTWEQYLAAKDSLNFVDQYVEHQKLALDGVRQEYEVGAKTMIDVLKTQEDYNKAKVQAVETKKDYIRLSYNIKALIGSMLGHQLKLNVKYFSPEKEFRNIKYRIIGF